MSVENNQLNNNIINTSKTITEIKKTIQEYSMIQPGDKILLAVSGGPDSVALVYALYSIREQLQCNLFIFHLNHMLRGEESDADELFVRELADQLYLPYKIERADIKKYQQEKKITIETAAREVRYGLMDKTGDYFKANKIALGHHADDQAETVLMNLLRGAGTTGLAGIAPKKDRYIRPLINIFRTDIIAFLQENKFCYRTDSTNSEIICQRNKIRLELMPKLKAEYNNDLTKALMQTASILNDEEEYLKSVSLQWSGKLINKETDGLVSIDAVNLSALPKALARRVIRIAWELVNGSQRGLDFEHLEIIRKESAYKRNKVLTTCPGNIEAKIYEGKIYFQVTARGSKINRGDNIPGFLYYLQIPGYTYIKETNQTITAEFVSALPDRPINDYEAYLAFDKGKGLLAVRNRRKGDFFYPLGSGGKKKVKDFYIDKKIPKEQRGKIPLFCQNEQIMWIGGYRISEKFKVTDNCSQIVYLRLE